MAKLSIGSKAPDFKLKDTEGIVRTLKDYKNKIPALYFYPKDDTPGCTKEACSLRDGFTELKNKGIEILGVSPDSEESHKKFTAKHNLPFPLLADTEKEVTKKYGVWGEKSFMGKKYLGVLRTTFIIQNGKIIHIIEKVDTENHAKQILEVLKK